MEERRMNTVGKEQDERESGWRLFEDKMTD